MLETGIQIIPVRAPRRGLRLSVGGWISGGLLLVIGAIAVLAPALAPYNPAKPVEAGALQPISGEHLLGTDGFARDTLSRIIFGTRVSMTVGISVMIIVFIVGMSLGLLAAYAGKWLDMIIGRLIDTMLSIPGILLAIALLAILGANIWSLVIALSFVGVPEMTRVVRGSALSARSRLHVQSAISIGASPARVMLRHIAPFVIGPAVIQATFIFAFALLSEAALSFLGVGVQPPTASWGNMVSDALRYLAVHPVQIVVPSIAITIVVLLANLFGDAMRDLLDPDGARK